MISLHPWSADLKRARAACVLGILLNQGGYCRLTALVRSSFIQQVCRGFVFFVKNIMALSSVGLYSAIQMEDKAATVQWLRSTTKLQRFETFAPINAENEASNTLRCWSQNKIDLEQMLKMDHRGHTSGSYVWWTVLKIEGQRKEKSSSVIPSSLLKHIPKPEDRGAAPL